MSESIRSIRIAINVDTNKRTLLDDIEADTLDDALDQMRDLINDLRWSIR